MARRWISAFRSMPLPTSPAPATFLASGAVNPLCNGFLSYSRNGRVRTSMPTEQLSLQSNYFKTVDLSGRVSYTGGDMNVDGYQELFTGRESRTGLRNNNVFGPAFGRHVAATVDFGATWHVTDKFRDAGHVYLFQLPQSGPVRLFKLPVFQPRSCDRTQRLHSWLPAIAGVSSSCRWRTGTPVHSSSSGPDISQAIEGLLLKQDEKTNLFQLEYDFTRKFGARLGYRFRHRAIADSDFEQVNEIFYPSNANRGDCALVAGASAQTDAPTMETAHLLSRRPPRS